MRIAIVSDIHGNLEALTAVMEDIEKQKVDQVACLGDIVGYGPNPRECLDILRQRIQRMKLEVRRTSVERQKDRIVCQRISYRWADIPAVVKGNHEEGATNAVFLEDKYEFSRRAREMLLWTKSVLTHEEREWLKILPYGIIVPPHHRDGRRIMLAHAEWTVPEEFHYLIADDKDPLGDENMLIIGENSILFYGHTHEQAIYISEGWKVPPAEQGWEYQLRDEKKVVVNPGSVGQPRVTNHGKAGYAIYDTESDKVIFHNISYAYEETIRKIMELPEPPVTMKTKQSLAERLRPQK